MKRLNIQENSLTNLECLIDSKLDFLRLSFIMDPKSIIIQGPEIQSYKYREVEINEIIELDDDSQVS